MCPIPISRRRSPAKRRRLKPVDRPDMVAAVLEQLGEQIMNGGFGPDGVLPPEGTLAETFGVSRTVIREAMRTLRAQGLVEVSQGRAPRVKPAGPEAAIASLELLLRRSEGSLLHLLEARRPIESEIARLAAERATPEQIEQLEQENLRLRQASSLDERVEADVQFHRLLAESAGNPVFGLLLETIAGLLRESRRQTIAQSGIEIAAAGHTAILEAVRRHDGNRAKDAMLEHLQLAERDLRAAEAQPAAGKRRA